MERGTLFAGIALLALLIATAVVLAGMPLSAAPVPQKGGVLFIMLMAVLYTWAWAREWYVDRKRASLGLGPRFQGIPQGPKRDRPT